jgi:two-component system chemotaxis sensor kinase CheA
MSDKPLGHARYRDGLIGAAFGTLLAAAAFLAVSLLQGGTVVLLVIISLSVPVFGVAGWLIGQRDDRMRALTNDLERRMDERTTAIRNMLDVTGDGFLTFGPDYRVNPEYSKACEEIFGGPIAGKRFPDLLYIEERPRQELVEGLDLYFTGKAKADVIFDLLDEQVEVRNRAIRLTYRAIDEQTVMCALTDVTEQQRLEAAVEEQNRRRDLILRAVSNKGHFASFVDEAHELFQVLDAAASGSSSSIPPERAEALAAQVHTFKGNAGFLGFVRTATVAHDFEDQLAALPILEGDVDLSSEVFVLKRQFYEEYNAIAETLGQRWINDLSTIGVPVPLMRRVERYVKSKHADDGTLVRAMEQLRSVPIVDMFSRFPQLIADVAGRRGRRVKPVEVLGGEFRVLPERYEHLVDALTHVARNMVDHGIESPSERELKGKPPEGEIKVEITRDSGEISMAFSDDGQGISFAAVEERARARGLIRDGTKPTRAQLLSLLFSSGLSTADQVTAVSGRGIGLNAVHRAVRELGGKISVETRPGRGTTMRITVPERGTRRAEGRKDES